MNLTGVDNRSSMSTTSSTTVTSSGTSSGMNQQQGAVAESRAVSGCAAPMSQNNFNQMKQSVESKPFSDTKMSTAKIATKNSCLSAAQISEICKLFSMDDDKLAYAKYAYSYCVDRNNYYRVGEVF